MVTIPRLPCPIHGTEPCNCKGSRLGGVSADGVIGPGDGTDIMPNPEALGAIDGKLISRNVAVKLAKANSPVRANNVKKG